MTASPAPQFGTDGIRGLVGDNITEELLYCLGLCAAEVLATGGAIAVGRDTRSSGAALHQAFCDGVLAGGCNVLDVGVMPSGILGWLCGDRDAIAGGAMITASHNPEAYNGIKFYDAAGGKISRDVERKLLSVWPGEKAASQGVVRTGGAVASELSAALCRYAEAAQPLHGLSLVIDCAYGASSVIASELYESLGARVSLVFAATDASEGRINDGCGSEHPQQLVRAVRETEADFGIALDGDGDRLVIATADGRLLDGDDILYLHAGLHKPTGIAGTVMSNIGLENALASIGIAFSRSDVGEIPLHSHMLERGWQLGGEPSGHLLHLSLHQSADGLINAFDLLHRVKRQSADVRQMLSGFEHYSQYAINLPWQDAAALQGEAVQECISRFQQELIGGDKAASRRLLVRMSGTEPVLRLMVESEDAGLGRSVGDQLAAELQRLAAAVGRDQRRATQ